MNVVELELITCPDCSAPHSLNMGNVCVICGYNFQTGAHGEIPYPVKKTALENSKKDKPDQSTASEDSEGESTMDLNNQNSPSPFFGTWELVAIIDPALCHPESPHPPINQPP